jgi:hypothetical protein
MLMTSVVSAALLKEARASASVGGGGRKRQNLMESRLVKVDRWNGWNALWTSEEAKRYAWGSPILRTGSGSGTGSEPQGE